MKRRKLRRLRDILPLIDENQGNKTLKEVSEMYGVHVATVGNWVKKLREAGFEIDLPKSRRGSKKRLKN